jgi:hypothetical protein
VKLREDLKDGNRALLAAQTAAKIREQAKEQVVGNDAVVQKLFFSRV